MSDPSIRTNHPLSATAYSALRADLRKLANQHLPSAAVPSQFIVVPELPKLANGKVDRQQLASARRGRDAERSYTAPETPLQMRIAAVWADLLKVNRVGLHDHFFELGGNSLIAVQLAARVRAETGIALNWRRFFERPTVAWLAELLDGRAPAQSVGASPPSALSISADELRAEARLPEDVCPDPLAIPCRQAPYRTVFLTGGNGYTGAYLIRELLERSDVHLFVLVRADDQEHAHRRIRTTMDRFGIWREDASKRITPVVGDLARPYLGLSRPIYARLAREADVIIHNGALSSYALSYHALKPVNVLGTQEILRLACRDRIKPVHYVSSLGVYPDAPGRSWAEAELTDPEGVTGGYVQTKWVGDSLMLQAGRRGVPVSVYRLGLITGAQDTGACESDTFINAIIKGCIQLGAVPADSADSPLEIVPVDFCAAAIANIALDGNGLGKVYNIPGARGMMVSDLVRHLETYGYRFRRLPFHEWYLALTSAVERGVDNELARFLPVLESSYEETPDHVSRPIYETMNLQSALAGSGIVCSAPDEALWKRYLDWFIAAGFLPGPEAARSLADEAARAGSE